MKWIIAFLGVLMLACIATADDFSDRVAAFEASTKPKKASCICGQCDCAVSECGVCQDKNCPAKLVAAGKKKSCDCAGPADCTCDSCTCAACLFWAYDADGGGYDLCTKTRVVGYLYPSGKFVRRDVHDGYTTWTPAKPPIEPPAVATAGATDALEEVNAARARLGLRPFKRDPGLTLAALRCSRHRADRGIEGHVNDFAFLPAGCAAGAAGCAAWPAHMGWGSCCWTENWEYAGAAYAVGADGRRYMHIFVAGAGSSASPVAQPATVACRS